MTNDDSRFTLSLKEYLDDKFKVVSQRIDSLTTNIESLIRDTNHTKERIIIIETDTKDLHLKHEDLTKRVDAHYRGLSAVIKRNTKIFVIAFILGTMLWVPQSRLLLWNIISKWLLPH